MYIFGVPFAESIITKYGSCRLELTVDEDAQG